MLSMLQRFANHPGVALATGLVLLVSAGMEAFTTVDDLRVGAHHGVVPYAFVHILKALPDLRHGVEAVNEGV